MALRAALFDFDFTLADSSQGAIACINHALDSLRLPPASPDQICATIGLSLPATFACLTGLTDPPLVAAFSQHFITRADAVMADLTRVYPEVPGVVQALHQAGMTLGIVSSKLRYRIEGITAREGLLTYFPVIVGADDVPHHKPHPAGLEVALRQLGCSREEAVYVGDHPVDAEAAARAGVPFVAVLSGASQRNEFLAYPVVAFLETLSALPGCLKIGGVSAKLTYYREGVRLARPTWAGYVRPSNTRGASNGESPDKEEQRGQVQDRHTAGGGDKLRRVGRRLQAGD